MSKRISSQLVSIGVEVAGFKGCDADQEAEEFQKVDEPPLGLSTANYNKIVSFFLLCLRGNEPMATAQL